MNRWLSVVLGVCAISVTIAVCLSLHCLDKNLDKWGDGGQQSFAALNATLETVNRPCGAKDTNGKLLPCGTLAEVGKATVKVSDILVTTQKQEQDTAKVAQQTMVAVNQVANHLNATADALTGTANSATKVLNTTNDTVASVQPVMKSLAQTSDALTQTANAGTATINSVNAKINDPQVNDLVKHLSSTMTHVDGTMAQWEGISTNVNKMSAHAEKDFDAKSPWYKKIIPYSSDAAKVVACVRFGVCI